MLLNAPCLEATDIHNRMRMYLHRSEVTFKVIPPQKNEALRRISINLSNVSSFLQRRKQLLFLTDETFDENNNEINKVEFILHSLYQNHTPLACP